MIRSTGTTIVFLVAASVPALGGYGAEDKASRKMAAGPAATREPSKDNSQIGAGSVEPESRPLGGTDSRSPRAPDSVFVEVVFEIADAPIVDDPLPTAEIDRLDGGYYLKQIDPNRLRLYPAVGKPPDEKTLLWVGTRSRSHIADEGGWRRSLQAVKGKKYVLRATRGKGWSSPLADLYVDEIELSTGENPALTVKAVDEFFAIQPGQDRTIASKQLSIDRLEWADVIIAAMKEATGKAPGREEVLAQLNEALPGSGPISLFSRTSVIYHGGVTVSGFDALDQWRRAQRTAVEGPYEDAQEALGLVLEAAPRFRQATELLKRIKELVRSGAKPARITGRLKFPDGMPTEEQKAMWKQVGAGFALLATPEAPEGSGFASAPIKDGSFTIPAKTGAYRLSILVSGFSPVEKTIELSSDKVVVIEMQP